MFALFEKMSVYLQTTTVLLKYKYISVSCATANDLRKHNFYPHFDDETKKKIITIPIVNRFSPVCAVRTFHWFVKFNPFHHVRIIRRIFDESICPTR